MRVCMEYWRPLLGIKNTVKFSIKNTSHYFYTESLVVWPLTMLKRTHFSELYISRFTTIYIDLAKPKSGTRIFFSCTSQENPFQRVIHFQVYYMRDAQGGSPFPNTRSEEWKMQAETSGWAQIQGRIQAHILQFHFNSLPIQSSPWNRRWAAVCFQNPYTFTATNETSLVTLPPLQTERLLSTLYKLLWSLSPTWLDYLWSTTKVHGERRISQVCRYFCWLSEKRKLLTCNVNLYVCE